MRPPSKRSARCPTSSSPSSSNSSLAVLGAGRRQCAAVARALAGSVIAAVYASPLERARTSAELIAKPHDLPVRVAPAFAEMAFGPWEGLTREEVRTRFPEAWEQWRSAPHLCKLMGGDTLSGVAERVAAGLEELREAHAGQTVVLVSHAIVARVIVLAALGLGLDRLWTVDAAPAGVPPIRVPTHQAARPTGEHVPPTGPGG